MATAPTQVLQTGGGSAVKWIFGGVAAIAGFIFLGRVFGPDDVETRQEGKTARAGEKSERVESRQQTKRTQAQEKTERIEARQSNKTQRQLQNQCRRLCRSESNPAECYRDCVFG